MPILQVAGLAVLLLGPILLLFAAVTIYSSVVIVEEDDCFALLVFGEFRAVMGPGINFVPPFVSSKYPVDPQRMVFEKGTDTVEIPEESRDRVRELAGIEDDDDGIEY